MSAPSTRLPVLVQSSHDAQPTLPSRGCRCRTTRATLTIGTGSLRLVHGSDTFGSTKCLLGVPEAGPKQTLCLPLAHGRRRRWSAPRRYRPGTISLVSDLASAALASRAERNCLPGRRATAPDEARVCRSEPPSACWRRAGRRRASARGCGPRFCFGSSEPLRLDERFAIHPSVRDGRTGRMLPPRCERQSPGLRVPCPRRLAGVHLARCVVSLCGAAA